MWIQQRIVCIAVIKLSIPISKKVCPLASNCNWQVLVPIEGLIGIIRSCGWHLAIEFHDKFGF